MLNRSEEDIKMSNVEQNHWWYKSLHMLVLRALTNNINGNECRILDAGCGTAGLLLFLQKKGYNNQLGFDVSNVAVNLCRKKGLNVFKGDLKEIVKSNNCKNGFDVIISNDTLYYLNREEVVNFINDCHALLNSSGILIMNIPTHNVFGGIHDKSVGIKSRFKSNYLEKVSFNKFKIIDKVAWPFLLFPIILLIRFFQRIKMHLFPNVEISSDIDMPANIINNLLYKVTFWEINNIRRTFFSSSMFIVLRKIDF